MNKKINKKNIALGYHHSIAIGKNGNLYAWGNNGSGQLGTGIEGNEYIPKKVFLEDGIKPLSLAAGSYHSMAICDDGKLYSWGSNSYSNLGLGHQNKIITPKVVEFPQDETPIFITANDDSSIAITNKENLYVWGYNNHGQLGLGEEYGKIISKPQLVNLPKGIKPIFVALGDKHLVLLSEDNNIYTCGFHKNEQLGLKSFDETLNFEQLNLPQNEKPISVDAKGESIAIVTESGNIYIYKLTYGKIFETSYSLPNKTKAVSVVLGLKNFYIFDDNGDVYDYREVVEGIDIYTPEILTLRNGVKPKGIATGQLHSIVFGDDGKLYACGINHYGQLGTGNRVDQKRFQEVDLF